MEQALDKLIPFGYSVFVDTDITVLDESGNRAKNLVLRNKKLAEADITLSPAAFVYDLSLIHILVFASLSVLRLSFPLETLK